MSDLETVNSTKLTITKLSKLQRHIIHEFIRSRWIERKELYDIAFSVATEYEPRETKQTKQRRQQYYENEVEIFKEHPEFRVLGSPRLANPIERNLEPSYDKADDEILSNLFKAAFYRSLKRLKQRDILLEYTAIITEKDGKKRYAVIMALSEKTKKAFQGCISLRDAIREVQP